MTGKDEGASKDEGNWAAHVERLQAGGPNVEGRRLTSPLQGFGQMWQKTFRIAVPVEDPAEVISVWKKDYDRFWPDNMHFDAPLAGIKPGEVGRIDGTSGPVRLATGVLVLYADETSFAYMTPEGHPWAGMITFSSYREDDQTIVQVQLLVRTNDPLYEIGFMLFGSRQEDRMWQHTLRSLAEHLGGQGEVETRVVKIDKKRQWRHVGNIRHSAMLRGLIPRRKASRS